MEWIGAGCSPHMLTFAQTFDRLFRWASWTSYKNPPWGGGAARYLTFLAQRAEAGTGWDWWVKSLERPRPTVLPICNFKAHSWHRKYVCPLCSVQSCPTIRNPHPMKGKGRGQQHKSSSCGCFWNNQALNWSSKSCVFLHLHGEELYTPFQSWMSLSCGLICPKTRTLQKLL